MTEQPANIAREAKGIHQSLKELLKRKEPFDKEVDFQRKNLRRRYLNLLLVHPYAKESKDVENHLWMQTSYAFIASYKQRILNLDRIIQSKLKQQQQPQAQPAQPQQPQQNPRANNSHVVEHRKLVQRFRQFLADEEKFWTQLVVRLRRSFKLEEVTPALVALGILSETEEPLANLPDGSDSGGAGRNHFQFPPEDSSAPFMPTTPEEKELWLSIVSKTLICLGDIARYRELYNEGGGRPKAGQEEGPPRRGRNRRGGQAAIEIPGRRNYEKAQQCYEQARLLVPTDGNPSHQLAIIDTYRKDSFGSLTHYYRALCVRTPYDTASENLSSVLSKALEQWRNRSRRERERTDTLPPRVQIELFKEKIVVLHALWKVGMDKGIKKMESLSRRHNNGVFDDFLVLLANRYLPTDMISNAIVLSQGALWKHRMIRTTPTAPQTRRPEVPPPPEGTSLIVEWNILDHLLDLHRALLEVGKDELRVPPPRDAPGDDLAQRITAVFRRTLPALRIASKWLRANFKYMLYDHEFDAYREMKATEGVDVTRDPDYQYSRSSRHTKRFWWAYAEFLSSLSIAFPTAKLPPFTAPLEEDIEMRGFLPLKRMMGETAEMKNKANEDSKEASIPRLVQEAHPNDLQLMRIADLLEDAKELTALPNSPISESYGIYRFVEELMEPEKPQPRPQGEEVVVSLHQQNLLTSIRDTRFDTRPTKEREEDNMTELTSHTDDDIFHDVFQALHPLEDEEEQVLYPRAAPIVPTLPTPSSHATPVTHHAPLLKSPVKASPTHTKTISSPFMSPTVAAGTVAPTTAQDLVNDVISGRSTRSHLESSAPQPALLFGSELAHRQGHNIWSASQEEQSLRFTGQPNHIYSAKQPQVSASMDMSQSIWSSSYPTATQNSQLSLGGTLPPAAFGQSHLSMQPTHQRVPSATIGSSQAYLNQSLGPQDPFAYPQHTTQQPIHRPDVHGFINSGYIGSPSLPPSASPEVYYQNSHIPGYHSHLSVHDPRMMQPFAPPPASQLWSNIG
ncbi:Protein SMG7 [Hypsizygus marmoreus]|uniref:Protein SMG7 n=1 Tax=Hypsizygus marmoreus TaxID=39966 RepID=A0A369JA64_HYPMA|nr:Protein SMG7 [Hypsizygus marmoreus]